MLVFTKLVASDLRGGCALPIGRMPAQRVADPTTVANGDDGTMPLIKEKEGLVVPSYAELPAVPDMPHGCTWGLWDKDGHQDEIGTLNLLTPSVVRAAKDEIQHGRSFAINWTLDNCETPHSGRRKPSHRIMPLPDWVGHDDEVEMNTQSGSQWDGFREQRHFLSS